MFGIVRQRSVSPIVAVGSLLLLFVGLPLVCGAYDNALHYIPRDVPFITVISAVIIQILFFYVAVLGIKLVVAEPAKGLGQSFLRIGIPLVCCLFWVASYTSLGISGRFLSFRTVAALFTLDAQIAHHTSLHDQGALLSLVVAAVVLGTLLRYALSGSISPKEAVRLRMRMGGVAVMLGLVVAVNLETSRRGSVADIAQKSLSPEFFAARDLYHFFQDLAHTSSDSFAKMPSVTDWAKTDTDAVTSSPDVFIIVVEALRGDVLSPENNPQSVVPNLYSFSRRSWNYSRAYAAAPDTGYALESIITGTYPYHGPLRHICDAWNGADFPHLYDLFNQRGYRTGFFSATNWLSTARLMKRPSLDVYYDPSHIGQSFSSDDVLRHERALAGW